MSTTLPSTAALAQALAQAPPHQNYAAAPYYSQTISPMAGPSNNQFSNFLLLTDSHQLNNIASWSCISLMYFILNLSDNVLMNNFNQQQGIINLAHNFTCGRNYIMGDIVQFAAPYLYPFVVEYSLIASAVIFAMWRSIGSNPR